MNRTKKKTKAKKAVQAAQQDENEQKARKKFHQRLILCETKKIPSVIPTFDNISLSFEISSLASIPDYISRTVQTLLRIFFVLRAFVEIHEKFTSSAIRYERTESSQSHCITANR